MFRSVSSAFKRLSTEVDRILDSIDPPAVPKKRLLHVTVHNQTDVFIKGPFTSITVNGRRIRFPEEKKK